jgi:hypothetical protein
VPNAIPGGDFIATFHLNAPGEHSYQYGELHLVWVPPVIETIVRAQVAQPTDVGVPPGASPLLPSASAVIDRLINNGAPLVQLGGESPATEAESPGEESAPLVAEFNSLNPAQLDFIQARVDATLPPEGIGSEMSIGPVVIGAPKPIAGDPIVLDEPDELNAEVRAAGWGALCKVTAGVTPHVPNYCVALNTAHIEAESFAAQSGNVATFGTEIDFGSGIRVHYDSWVQYPEVNFGSGNLDTFVAFMATRQPDDRIEIRLDDLRGKKIAVLKTERSERHNSGSFAYSEQSASMASVTGVHDIFIVFKEGNQRREGERHIGDFDWFGFRHTGARQVNSDRSR